MAPRSKKSSKSPRKAAKPKASRKRARPKRRRLVAEDLLRLKGAGGPSLSPDGRRIVFSVKTVGDKNAYHHDLWMTDVEAGTSRRFTGGHADSQPAWSPDGTCIAFVSHRDKQRPQIALIDPDGGEARTLTCLPEGTLASFRWSPKGDRIVISFREQDPDWTQASVEARKGDGRCDPPRVLDDPMYRYDGDGYFNAQRFHLYAVDVDTGDHSLVYDKSRTGVGSYDVSPDGKEVALVTQRDRYGFARSWTSEVVRVDLRSGKVRPVKGLPPGGKDTLRWSPDGKRLAVAIQPDEHGVFTGHNLQLWVAELAKDKARSLTAKEDYCLAAPTLSDASEVSFSSTFAWSPDSRRLWVQIGWHGATQLFSVAARGGGLVQHTRGKAQHLFGDVSADGSRLAMLVGDATHPGEVHVAEVPASAALAAGERLAPRRVSALNDALLSELELSTPKEHWVESEDGTKVHTWVLLPPGASASRKHPTTLQIHGGPMAQYGWALFHEFQLYAARGYAVVYSNPRGSKGYGQQFCDDITHKWGTKDWEDVRAVTEWMQTQPWCDKKRLGVSGGSFGGFMTLWTIGHTRAYKCAVSDRCVSNMVSMWGSSDVYIWPGSYFPGNTWDDTEALWGMSPLKFIGRVKTPTLIVHSEGDLRCNIAESDQVYAALSMRGVPTRYVRYPRNTSHGMSRAGPPDMRLHRLDQYLQWYDRWLKK